MSKFKVLFYEKEDGTCPIIVGSNIVRAFYFFCWNREIVMTNGFVKKTEKTPRREIRLAKKYRDDYLRRFANENS